MWTHDFRLTPSIGAARIDRYDFVPSANLFGTPVARLHFFDLTPEIRTLIYLFLPQTGFGFFGDEILAETMLGAHSIAFNPPIAATCRFLRHEVLQSYFSQSIFRFMTSGSWAFGAFPWVDAQYDFCISHMNSIIFDSLTSHHPKGIKADRKNGIEADPDKEFEHDNDTSIRHYDKIAIDVRRGSVTIQPTRLLVCDVLVDSHLTCGNCDHVEYLDTAAARMQDLLNRLPIVDGSRKMDKETLKRMMNVAIGIQVDGQVVLVWIGRLS
ncbi:hypothetical protein CKM354_000206900 [Cercospora kikuchii]|uniref:Uncharacterized protein n=1 Tax=Cercospora kikuchii TaxID=84275 RepID=A0A9P3C944_9PEZI|nr:uncharacterized protein CKM354_000206900 [Cercospora kikuchii]GIZ38659.1 hypothetical protein CKM354_000206900 [Cercospora kikuchii]